MNKNFLFFFRFRLPSSAYFRLFWVFRFRLSSSVFLFSSVSSAFRLPLFKIQNSPALVCYIIIPVDIKMNSRFR
uniref:Uncharacterized protein n=1 Tax=Meloidogyne enterolobii TaxID=390850 RepID=A0A6V7VSK7_MELEN|nr:unnamed protein product [Meloidogyne enterolobii]